MEQLEGLDERGHLTLIMAVVLLLASVASLGVARLGAATADRAAAQAAADAAALPAAATGESDAVRVASANDAVIRSYERIGDDVVVAVERRGVRAEARARWTPV